jgi:energy-converting hydrogenase A subunit R
VLYVGDRNTDVDAFKIVRENGGLTVSFNGNSYAVENAELAVLSDTGIITSLIADLFFRMGKKQALELIEDWNINNLKRSGVPNSLLGRLQSAESSAMPKVQIVTNDNMKMLARESSSYRKKVRGEAIGGLG